MRFPKLTSEDKQHLKALLNHRADMLNEIKKLEDAIISIKADTVEAVNMAKKKIEYLKERRHQLSNKKLAEKFEVSESRINNYTAKYGLGMFPGRGAKCRYE